MKSGKQAKIEPKSVALSVEVRITQDTMHLRQELASGSFVHERQTFKVELTSSVGGGAILVTITPPEKKKRIPWTVYAFKTEALIRTCIDHYLSERRTK